MLQNSVGAYRLSKEEMHDAETLGFTSASKYLRYKLSKLKEDNHEDPELEEELRKSQEQPLKPSTEPIIPATTMETSNLNDEVYKRIRAEEELKYLKQKMSEQQGQLNGYFGEVEKRIQEELLKRDHELLKKELAQAKKELDGIERENENLEVRNKELEKQMQFLDTLREFTPQIVNGLAGRFPRQAERIANSLAGIVPESSSSLSEEDKSDLEFSKHFKSLFTDSEFREVMNLCIALSQNKNLLPLVRQFLSKVSQKNNNPQSNG
jgi:hypothetical protein